MIAGFVAVGVPIFATACLIEAKAESNEVPSDELVPFLETYYTFVAPPILPKVKSLPFDFKT